MVQNDLVREPLETSMTTMDHISTLSRKDISSRKTCTMADQIIAYFCDI